MGSTRREFIKDAAVIGAVSAAGTASYTKEASSENEKEADAGQPEERCPYFDQPLLCKGLAREGAFLCDE